MNFWESSDGLFVNLDHVVSANRKRIIIEGQPDSITIELTTVGAIGITIENQADAQSLWARLRRT